MPSAPKILLQSVVRISDSSVFLVPKEGEKLDFCTINSAPPAHRTVLQKNGFIAKVCLSVLSAPTDEGEKEALFSSAGRAQLWRDALAQTRLIPPETTTLMPPAGFLDEPWPLLSESHFEARMDSLAARMANEEVNTSNFCVPAIAMQRLTYRTKTVRAVLGVLWMPRYTQNLTEWAEDQIASANKPLSETKMMTVVQHATVGLMGLEKTVISKGKGAGSLDTHYAHPVGLEPDSILVYEKDGDVTFALALSPLGLCSRQRDIVANLSQTRFRQLNLLPYLAPEQIQPPETALIRSQRFAVWALGAISLAIGSGTPSLRSQLEWQNRRKTELPLNHPSIAPDAIVARVRRDLSNCGYSAGFIGLLGLLLAPDHLTRPTLRTLDRMLQDLNRTIPVHRFPFALGDLTLLRVPEPSNVQLNPSAHKYVTEDTCCYCKHQRSQVQCKNREHVPAACSPSWDGAELLPGFFGGSDGAVSTETVHMSYLYPLAPANLEDREKKRLLTVAVQGRKSSRSSIVAAGLTPTRGGATDDVSVSAVTSVATSPRAAGTAVNTSVGSTGVSPMTSATISQDVASILPASLFQLFGGFATYQKPSHVNIGQAPQETKERAVVTEVLVPFPTKGLRKCERMWSVVDLSFTAALPWPSACTKALQKRGRISGQVPAVFCGLAASTSNGSGVLSSPTAAPAWDAKPKYFAWIIPNESFTLDNGHRWVPAPEGGFAFWFNENLEPSDMDRYFAVTSVRSCTVSARVSQTVLPDHVFRKHVGDGVSTLSVTHLHFGQSTSQRDATSRQQTPRGMSASTPTSFMARRRSSLSVAVVDMPAGDTIYEEDPGLGPKQRSRTQSRAVSSAPLQAPLLLNAQGCEGLVANGHVGKKRQSSPALVVNPPSAQLPVLTSYEEWTANQPTSRSSSKERRPGKKSKSPSNETEEAALTDTKTSLTGNGSTPRATSKDTDVSVEPSVQGAETTVTESTSFGGTQTRKHRRTITQAERKRRLGAPKMVAVDEVSCNSPIVESNKQSRARRSSRAPNTAERRTTLPNSAPPATDLPTRHSVPSVFNLSSNVSRQPDNGRAKKAPTPTAEARNAPALSSLNVNMTVGAAPNKKRGSLVDQSSPTNTLPPRETPTALSKDVAVLPTVAPQRRISTPAGASITAAPVTRSPAVPLAAALVAVSVHTPSADPQLPKPQRRREVCKSSTDPVVIPQIALSPVTRAIHNAKAADAVVAARQDNVEAPVATVSLFGRYLVTDEIDAPFDSLTFYIPSTREHGTLQSPVAVTEPARCILHCPENAAFMSFMASETPLLSRNHQASHKGSCHQMILPHHGFAFYAANGAPMAFLSLRCGPPGSVDMDPEEFPIIGKPMPARVGISSASRHYYASYFTLADTPRFCRLLTPKTSFSHQASHLRHIGAIVQPSPTPQDPQLLTFSSARRLVGALTPNGSPATAELETTDDAWEAHNQNRRPAANMNPDTLLPVCWIGYDMENAALVLATINQQTWYPIVVA